MTTDAPPRPPPKQENLLLNLACNIVLPALILSKLSSEDRLGPLGALGLGLVFPLGYGIYDLIVRRKWNLFSIIGVFSVLLTGGLGLFKADGFWFAVKEAAMPSIFAVAVIVTLPTKKPLVRLLILNDSILDVARLDQALDEHNSRREFDQLLRSCTWMLAATFCFAAIINFVLARVILTSPSGTPEFTAELGRMTWVSYLVITLPFMIALGFITYRLFGGVHRLTGLGFEELLHKKPEKPAKGA